MATATSFCIYVIFGTIFVSIGGCGLIWWLSLETPPTIFLLKTDNGTIESINFDVNTAETLIADPNGKISAFDYYKDKTIYYGTNIENQMIGSWMKDYLEYPNLPDFTGQWKKTAIAVDEVNDKLYVLDGEAGKVYVTDLLGKHYAVLYTGLKEVIDIAIDPTTGLIFMLQKNAILQAEMDGSQKIPKKVIDEPNLTAFTLNPVDSELLYAAGDFISSYQYNEKQMKMKKLEIGKDVISMTVAEKEAKNPDYERLYFIKIEESKKYVVMSCVLKIGSACEMIRSHYHRPDLAEIKAYARYREFPENKCKDNGGCEHLCLLNGSKQGYSCVCNEGSKLKDDKKTCTPIENSM